MTGWMEGKSRPIYAYDIPKVRYTRYISKMRYIYTMYRKSIYTIHRKFDTQDISKVRYTRYICRKFDTHDISKVRYVYTISKTTDHYGKSHRKLFPTCRRKNVHMSSVKNAPCRGQKASPVCHRPKESPCFL